MKYLWLGNKLDKHLETQVVKNGGFLMSGYKSQESIISGIEKNLSLNMDSINNLIVPTFPKYKKIFIKKYWWTDDNLNSNSIISIINIPYLNKLSRNISMGKAVKKWIRHNKDSDVTVFIYAMGSHTMIATKHIKKKLPYAKIVLIVPDLPLYMDLQQSKFKRFLKSIDWKIIKKYMKNVDYYVLYAKHMVDFLGLKNDDYILMEGLIKPEDYSLKLVTQPNDSKKIIMYAGILEEDYGLKLLLDAFSKIEEKEYELWIAGTGKLSAEIERISKIDKRIIFFGYVDKQKLLELELKSTILVNMRLPIETNSKYSFPSKIIEYMLVGKPVLSFRLSGIPEEYFDYIIDIGSSNIDNIATIFKKITSLSSSELSEKGCKARDFILKEKNFMVQTRRILKLIKVI